MDGAWPWALLAGLGAYHGLNPAMGWLFAAALGIHRRSRTVMLQSLIPLALGHALAAATAVALIALASFAIDARSIRLIAGGALIAWALYLLLYGARHRVRVGMTAGFAGLFLWSFLMASAHGAGLMLAPALIPLCVSASSADAGSGFATLSLSLAAVGVHMTAMLIAMGAIAWLVYDWIGVGFLRRGWINLDLLWTAALLATGALLLVSAAPD
jgi:hypothetical protein